MQNAKKKLRIPREEARNLLFALPVHPVVEQIDLAQSYDRVLAGANQGRR